MANIWPTTLPVSANNKLTGTIFDDFMLGEPPGGALYDPPAIPPGNWGVPGGNDTFIASNGNDTIDGGDRIQTGGSKLDCVDYSKWGQKIYANLNLPTQALDDEGNPVPYVDPFGVEVPLVGSVYKGIVGNQGLFDTFVAEGYTGLAATRSSIEGIIGTAFNDEMLGDAKANKFKGNAGNDKIYGGGGNDTIEGNQGNDTLNGDDGNDVIKGGGNNDCIDGGRGQDTLDGGTGNDKIYGREARDSITGGTGNDTVWGGVENDTICGNDGNDVLWGDDGNVTGAGGGADIIIGGKGNDTIKGEEGNDTLDGGLGSDLVYGNAGDDLLVEANCEFKQCGVSDDDGNDTLDGGSGSDLFASGNDTAAGWVGDDVIYGRDGNDVLYGEQGFDSILGGDGDDLLTGDCIYLVCLDPEPPVEPINPDGNDTLLGGNGNDTIYGDYCEIECVPVGEFDCTDIYPVPPRQLDDAWTFDDVIDGGAGDDVLAGELGNDTITGGTGNDLISDGPGEDTVDGGAGNDTICAGDDDAYDLFVFRCDAYVPGEKDVIYDLERCFGDECEADVVDVAGAAIALALDWNVPCVTPADCYEPYDPAVLDCLFDTLVLGLFAPGQQIFLDNNVDADGDGVFDDSALTFFNDFDEQGEPAEYTICFINTPSVAWAGDALNPFLLLA
jgi:Ca2+-binding RTX toxin-like protein